MSIRSYPSVDPHISAPATPPLEQGDHLTRAEFERRYDSMPDLKKAELIEGVVHMPSPVRWHKHGAPHLDLGTWLCTYKSFTPGLEAGDNASIRLDLENMPQPDLTMLISPECGGQAKISEDDYVVNALELVAEIASSSASLDLFGSVRAYGRNPVNV